MRTFKKSYRRNFSVFGRTAVYVGVFSIILSACAGCEDSERGKLSDSARTMVLQREWTPNAEFAGDVLARSLLRDSAVNLEVRPGSATIDPLAEVTSGSAHLGVAASDRVLGAISRGEPLLIVGAATFRSPVIFVARDSARLLGPQDLRGKRVGIQTGTATDNSLRFLLAAHNIPASAVRIVDSGWNGVEGLLSGELDVLAVFAYDEPVRLEREGIQLDTLDPEKLGVQTVGTVYFTSRSVAMNRREDLTTALRALQRGWLAAQASPSDGIRAIRSLDSQLDTVKEFESLRRGLPFFLGEEHIPLFANATRWRNTEVALRRAGLIAELDLGQAVDLSFLMRSGDAGLTH